MKKNNKIAFNEKKNFELSYLIPVFFIGLIIILIIVNVSGSKQSEHFIVKSMEFKQAEELVANGEFEDAREILSTLHSEFPKEYNITYALAYVLLMVNEFESSEKMFKQAIDLNPYYVENVDVMYQFVTVLFNVQSFEEAEMVISKLETLPLTPEYIDSVNNLKLRIESMKGSK